MPISHAITFDDDQRRVGVVEFDYAAVDGEAEADAPDSVTDAKLAFDRRQAAAAILEILVADATPLLAGQRAFLLAHKLKLSGCKTSRQLAARMGITEGRVSQIAKAFNAHLDPANIG